MWLSVVGLAMVVAQPEIRGPLLGVRCGRIVIEGNTDTPDRYIATLLDLRPGQKIQLGSLRAAQERLRASGVFQTNPWRGVGPAVELSPPVFESEYWDVRIRVVERPGNWLTFCLLDLIESAVHATLFLYPARLCWALEYFVDCVGRDFGRGP